MGIFKTKKPKVETVIASPPEADETNAETQYIEQLSSPTASPPVQPVVQQTSPTIQQPEVKTEVREIPICLSQTQINNLIIENNIMLKELMAMANED